MSVDEFTLSAQFRDNSAQYMKKFQQLKTSSDPVVVDDLLKLHKQILTRYIYARTMCYLLKNISIDTYRDENSIYAKLVVYGNKLEDLLKKIRSHLRKMTGVSNTQALTQLKDANSTFYTNTQNINRIITQLGMENSDKLVQRLVQKVDEDQLDNYIKRKGKQQLRNNRQFMNKYTFVTENPFEYGEGIGMFIDQTKLNNFNKLSKGEILRKKAKNLDTRKQQKYNATIQQVIGQLNNNGRVVLNKQFQKILKKTLTELENDRKYQANPTFLKTMYRFFGLN